MQMIVGRSALNYWMGKYVETTDLDIWKTGDEESVYKTEQRLDISIMPKKVMSLFDTNSYRLGYACPKDLLAIKLSHMQYDIFWKKHKQDALFLKGITKGVYNEKLYSILVEHWKHEFGTKDYLSLYKTKDEFFDDFVAKEYEHDDLHIYVSRKGKPVYTLCLKDGQSVFIDKNKFDNLEYSAKIRMFQEEIAVIALERWIIPSIKSGKEIIPISVAWNKSLHKTITALTKGWASEFIIHNLEHYLHPLKGDILNALSILNLKEKYMSKKIDFEDFKVLLEEKYNAYPDNYGFYYSGMIRDGDENVGVKLVDREGGGEGGAEDCYSILEIDGVFYQVTYNYYSYVGYEFDYAEVTIVTPKQKTITVYE
jgi:hypothetical protein